MTKCGTSSRVKKQTPGWSQRKGRVAARLCSLDYQISVSKGAKCAPLARIDRRTRRTIAWVTGRRNDKTVRKLYRKLEHLTSCIFYSDDRKTFKKVLPKDRHVIGKKHTTNIESDNSNVRHDMARFTRRSKVVSQCATMVDLTLRLWHAVTVGGLFGELQGVFLDVIE